MSVITIKEIVEDPTLDTLTMKILDLKNSLAAKVEKLINSNFYSFKKGGEEENEDGLTEKEEKELKDEIDALYPNKGFN